MSDQGPPDAIDRYLNDVFGNLVVDDRSAAQGIQHRFGI